jgi:hypothetical protein
MRVIDGRATSQPLFFARRRAIIALVKKLGALAAVTFKTWAFVF